MCRGQLRDVFVRRMTTNDRGVHVNGGVAIMGYSGLAAGCPGCRHHGIFHTCIYLAPLCVPFLRSTYTRANVYGERCCRLKEKKEDRQGKQRAGGKRGKEKEEKGKGEREKSVRTSLQGSSRSATYGNVIRAFRWMLSCVFALLRNHVVLPSRSTLPFLSFLSLSSSSPFPSLFLP